MADNAAGRPVRAATSLRAVVDLVPDNGGAEELRLLTRAHMALASAAFERGGWESAGPAIEQAATAAERSNDVALITLCQSQRATLLGRSGNIADARSVMAGAVKQVSALESEDQAVLLLNYGVILLYSGDLPAARERLRRCSEIADAGGHERIAFMSRSNQGFAAHLAGDLPAALRLLQEAEGMDADVERPTSRLDSGRALLEAGLIPEAQETLAGAVASAQGLAQLQVLGEIEIELARAHVLLGQARQARHWADRAERRFARRRAPMWILRAQLLKGQAALLQSGAPRRTLQVIRRMSTEVATGDWLLAAEHRLVAAEAAWRCDEPEDAREHLSAIEKIRGRLPLRAQLQAAHLRAQLARSEGDPGKTRRILDAAALLLVREQAGSASTDVRAGMTMYAAPLAALHLQVSPDTPRALFECTERWRATSRRVPPVRPPADEVQAGLLRELREVRVELRDAPVGEARDDLLTRELQLRRDVRARAWEWGTGTGSITRVDYAATRQALADQDAELLTYFVRGDRLHALHLDSGRGRVLELGRFEPLLALARRARADLDVAGRHHLGPFTERVWGSLRSAMAALDKAMFGPVKLGDRRVVLVPHSSLVALPWALTPTLRGRPMVVASSATDWTTRSAAASTVQGRPAVVRALAGPGLQRADAEVHVVAEQWAGAQASSSKAADIGALGDALAEADLVHVAAHGTHHQQSPMFASVDLAGGPMYVYDMQSRGVGARHVVLSSCDVGRSTIQFGDEAVGLSAGLLGLGVQSVVAGTCRVPDAVAAQTMRSYHRHLSAGRPSDEALATAVTEGEELAAAFQLSGAAWRAPTGSRPDAGGQTFSAR